jgi:hypothetical protein
VAETLPSAAHIVDATQRLTGQEAADDADRAADGKRCPRIEARTRGPRRLLATTAELRGAPDDTGLLPACEPGLLSARETWLLSAGNARRPPGKLTAANSTTGDARLSGDTLT